MPFASKAQQRAAFAGAIPGFSKKRAKAWAAETDFSSIPERAKKSARLPRPKALQKAVRRSAAETYDVVAQPGVAKDALLTAHGENERRKAQKTAALEGLIKLCALISVRPPGIKMPSATTARASQSMRTARNTGAFSGMVPKTLPGPVATSQAVNPTKSLRTAITPTTTKAVGSPRAMPGF
jgi:hypothetical protein